MAFFLFRKNRSRFSSENLTENARIASACLRVDTDKQIRQDWLIGGGQIVHLDRCACSGRSLARLLRPAVLALLARKKAHGYDIVQRLLELEVFVESPPNISGVYKVLNTMEDEGLVASNWQSGRNGPAKRTYALTRDGEVCLRRWAGTLEKYRAQIEGLLAILDPERESPIQASPRKRAGPY
jgi:DNA-binding PadR family transcriptional regulator